MIRVKKPKQNAKKVIKSNILGRLGRVFITHAQKENFVKYNTTHKKQRELKKGVPNVPNIEKELKRGSNEIQNKAYYNNNDRVCIRCGKKGERYCYGETKSGEYKFGDFCLKCRPY